MIDKMMKNEKHKQSTKFFTRFLNFNDFIINEFLNVAMMKLKYRTIISENYIRATIEILIIFKSEKYIIQKLIQISFQNEFFRM